MRTLRVLLARLASLVPIGIGITIVVFVLVHLTPGDPVANILGPDYTPAAAEQLRHALGLDQPLPVQYWSWLGRVLRGDLGDSLYFRTGVTGLLLERVPNTLALAAAAMLVAVVVGIPAGVLAAVRRNSWVDHAARLVALVGVSLPVYLWGLILLSIFAVALGWLPTGGGLASTGPTALVLPAVTLGTAFAGLIARTARATTLEQLTAGYVRTAHAKGVRSRAVLLRHVFRNTLVPVVTVAGLQFGTLLGGAVITETVFSVPGIGRLLVESITTRDYPVLQGCVLVVAFGFVVINLVTDLVCVRLDPRIRS
ncbi:MAG: ABC transporter permease [Natronosporangium sp.]